jgi:hypothetical protein
MVRKAGAGVTKVVPAPVPTSARRGIAGQLPGVSSNFPASGMHGSASGLAGLSWITPKGIDSITPAVRHG